MIIQDTYYISITHLQIVLIDVCLHDCTRKGTQKIFTSTKQISLALANRLGKQNKTKNKKHRPCSDTIKGI